MNRLSKFGILAALAGSMAVGTAFAGPVELVITSGGQSTSILQGSGFPSSASYTGSINGWTITAGTGATSYAPYLNQLVGIDLGGYTVTCAGFGCSQDPLTISASATGFTTPIDTNGFLLEFSGNVNGGVAQTTAYYNTANSGGDYFCGNGSSCNMFGSLTLGSSSSSQGKMMLGGPDTIRSYSLTITDMFSASSSGLDPSYSVDTTIVQAPEPGALAIFAAGLLGCALFINRRRRASRQS